MREFIVGQFKPEGKGLGKLTIDIQETAQKDTGDADDAPLDEKLETRLALCVKSLH